MKLKLELELKRYPDEKPKAGTYKEVFESMIYFCNLEQGFCADANVSTAEKYLNDGDYWISENDIIQAIKKAEGE